MFKTVLFLLILCFFFSCADNRVKEKECNLSVAEPPLKAALFGKNFISTANNELGGCFSPDGNMFLYTIANNSYSNTFYTIFFSQKIDDKWSKPQIAPFSGQYSDADPFFSPDGKTVYFISYRPICNSEKLNSNSDIWFVEFNNGSWSSPKHLDETVNSGSDEYYPSVSKNGNLYFSSENGTNGYDVMLAKHTDTGFAKSVSIGDSVNTIATEYDAYIAPDETYLIFTSIGRKDGLGSGDLYISYKINNKWTKGKNLGAAVNSPFMDQCPNVTPDGKCILFTSFRDNHSFKFGRKINTDEYLDRLQTPLNGLGNIFWIDFKKL